MRSRFYHPPPWTELSETQFELPEPIFHHAIRVLRMQVGDVCELFDGAGQVAQAQICAVDKKSAQAVLLHPATLQIENESPLNITLAQCVSAAEKMDWTIEKAVELGVQRIVPILSARSQIKLTPERMDKKMQHWQRIIIAACAQCGRNRLPELHTPLRWHEWMTQSAQTTDYRVILHPDLNGTRMLSQIAAPTPEQTITLLVGPESGFSDEELHRAQQDGWTHAILGARILRTETAGLAALAALQALWGDF